ncbi:MAG: 4-(cytidine 5'-diphospho)-2-C-methyl-D-erythritol kinase [Bryobacteraceae bacterium]|jgi:4-diphosphocytidyl-2-C-methyl-D-erythritol kinase
MTRRARLKSLAKVNLDLRVLQKRSDGFHELRTVFQTISLADTIEIEFETARRTKITVEANVEIPDNLLVRSAQAIFDELGMHARLHFRLKKRIPMGGGMGGGSSNSAAVLLAVPVLAGRFIPIQKLVEIGADLGSDVPFFLIGGTAVALGRGTEIYGVPDISEEPILAVSPGVHVATGPAYQALGRSLTFTQSSSSINTFQTFVQALENERSARVASALSGNDFEAVVFRQHPKLKKIVRRLREVGVAGARMTGSGSGIFALFRTEAERDGAQKVLNGDQVFRDCGIVPARLVSRRSYRRLWHRQLSDHLNPDKRLWPPRSRYVR